MDFLVEGLSLFVVEMFEIKFMFSFCIVGSLIMVDEFGRGTEVSYGIVIGGVVVEVFDECGVCGIFVMYLYGILDLLLCVLLWMCWVCMEMVKLDDGSTRSMWRMVLGECRELFVF